MARRAMKPNKAVAKRFKVTKTGKLKRHHAFTSHLMSARPAKRRRKLRMPAIVHEGFARRYRGLMGISKSPGKIAMARLLARQEKAKAAAAAGTDTAAA